jgi:glycogen operon protein
VNFVTCHDGFTLHDLVSYNEKHNEANLEENRDGESHNNSWNCGAEGPSDDPAIRALRERQKRNLLATLFLSQGVPMLLAGDEMGRTQQGNNNAYCQDNDISWVHWGPSLDAVDLTRFIQHLIALRRGQPVLTRRQFFQGRPIRGGGVKDITWFEPNGREMSDETWNASSVRGLGVRLLGTEIEEVDEQGDAIAGDTLFLMFNAHHEAIRFVLPRHTARQGWERLLDTAETDWAQRVVRKGSTYSVAARSVVVFRLLPPPVPGDRR